ncbi:hypothetical protein [Thermochromatium tepidum]|uniref:Periplasmic protein-like protein n=1 Tax=Thermochromatium tepidum ATCC 43061 TaxID=316276 RepID=A0A6I6DZ22_THETI|nr:hypothetical protein [Thermochromatium tepidum]QGU32854.1 hypothetical protein E6P07_07590 [Thermochromatium tepidum ATCC 43061]
MPRPVGWLGVILLTGLMLAGCGSSGERPDDAATPLDREALLTTVASCHLLRVGQTNDVAATDATVIVAADKYHLSITSIVERANRMVKDYEQRPSDLIARALESCDRLSELTGTTPALVRFESDGTLRTAWLRIDGVEITPGFAQRTIAELRRRKAIGLVINSPGGSVEEARKLGRYLRANGLRTAVDDYCASACIDVLAGGVERYATRSARIGVHQSKVPHRYSSHEGGQLYVADAFLYLREMGVDPDVAIAAATVPNDRILIISLAEALAARLITGVIEGFD